MVKISIKKDKKAVKLKPKPKPKAKPKPKPKPPQKENQTQSQNVVVNVGSNGITAKRAPRQALQKGKVVNRQQTTPTQINVPQALPIQQQPQQPMNELIKYLKENENQKEIIKQKDQKINELEKDKKDKERSKILTEDEVQDSFSNVYNNSNISSLTTSGTTTPRLSFPVDSNSLITALRRESDLRSENPNSGVVSLSTPSNDLFSLSSNRSNSNKTFTTIATNNTKQTDLSSIISDPFSFPVQQSKSLDVLLKSIPKTLTPLKLDTAPPATQDEVISDIIATQVDQPGEETVAAIEEPVIQEEILKEEPENQITVYEPQRATAQTATATQQMMGMDNSSIPTFLRPINVPSPIIRLNDIIGQRPTATETKDIRQARIDKLDKKPVLAIEDEKVDIPVISEEDMKNYKKQTEDARKAEETTESQEVGSSVEGYDDFVKYISNKNTYNWKLADILIKNGITDPKTGNGFYIRKIKGSDKQIAMIHGSNKTVDKTYLTELLRQKYNEGLIKNYLN